MQTSLISQLWTPIILFFCALFVRATFAFLETSITALRLFKLKELAKKTGRYEFLFQTLEKYPHRVIITTLICSSVADVTTAALAAFIMEAVFSSFNLSSGLGFSFGIGFASIAIIIFGEIIPKNFARERGEKALRSMLWLLNIVYYLLYPLVSIMLSFSDAIIYRIGGKHASDHANEWVSSEHEIRFLIDYIHDKGIMEREKTEMLRNIFDLGQTQVKDIMVPAPDIILIEINTPLKEALQIFAHHSFTRLPVFEVNPDNIVGMVHQKDVFNIISSSQDKRIKDIVRPIAFVPETVKSNQLLRELRQQQWHMAIVLDEHGNVVGLITLEDVLEEIVGEIIDEHEPIHQKIIPLPDGNWLIDGTVGLDDLGSALSISFDAEEAITVGGFLTERLTHVPKKGECIEYKHYFFQVQKATDKRVVQILVYRDHSKLTDNLTK